MIKVSFFQGASEEHGQLVIPLFNRATDALFEKTAAPQLLPEVSRYIASLRPSPDSVYTLVNAMGASEYYGSNVNGDAFTEASLYHKPDDWSHNPLLDAIKAKDWAYGFPTFYNAKPFAHHRNKDASKGFGDVELAAWNPRMKRVELVTRCDREKCYAFGGVQIWDKLRDGIPHAVSMGTKVPFDTCSVCLDWDKYRKAQANFDPKKHRSPGDAVLEWHKKDPIRGVSITRKDYCEHAKTQMNVILPDGRKVWVFNDYPRFFDISYVFIGADKTAFSMMKIAAPGAFWDLGSSALLAEKLGYSEDIEEQEKTASAEDEFLAAAFGKKATLKAGEITKDVVPSQFAPDMAKAVARTDKDIPKSILDALAAAPLEQSLATSGALGLVLRPREFQRITLVHIGRGDMANELEHRGEVFPKTDMFGPLNLGPDNLNMDIARLLMPLFEARSALAPAVEKRVLVVKLQPSSSVKEKKASTSHRSDLLRKISSAYNTYRTKLMDLLPNAQEVLEKSAYSFQPEIRKLASVQPEELFTPLTVAYVKTAFMDELGPAVDKGESRVERGFPLRNTFRPPN